MVTREAKPLIAVDIGNTRMKLGVFGGEVAGPASGWPMPCAELDLISREWTSASSADSAAAPLLEWLDQFAPRGARWRVASVFRAAAAGLQAWIAAARPEDDCRLLVGSALPIRALVEHPERVGIDRLLAAVAANRLRTPRRPAVIADLGSAITIDLVSAAGDFLGGAILPGIGMSARALCEQTDVLPHLPMTELDAPPPPLGRSTQAAIESGLFWGAVGAARELIARLATQCETPPEVFLTGGAAPSVAQLLGATRYEPHLVLAGIVLSE